MTRTPTYTPAFIRGWNAAMSHAEDQLVCMAIRAGTVHVKAVGRPMAIFIQKIMLGAADDVGKNRQPTKRHYG